MHKLIAVDLVTAPNDPHPVATAVEQLLRGAGSLVVRL